MEIKITSPSFRIKETPEIVNIRPEGEVKLVREPDNKYDKKAMKVMYDGIHIGYIPMKYDSRDTFPPTVRIIESFYADTAFAEKTQWCKPGDWIGMRIDVPTDLEYFKFGDDTIEYNDAEHTYTLIKEDGKEVSKPLLSPSKIAGLFSDGSSLDGFARWAVKFDSYEDYREGLNNAANKGTEVHEICENAFDGKTGHKVDNFIEKYSPKLVEKEGVCYIKELGVCGRFDALVEIKGKKILIDWKNGEYRPKYFVQFALYAKALGVEEGWCVTFKTKAKQGYSVKKIDKDKLDTYYKVACNLIDNYKLINGIK